MRQIARLLFGAVAPMLRAVKTSGDLIADRRYAYAVDLAAAGDYPAAVDLFQQAVERAPEWAAAWFALARTRRSANDPAGAAAAFRECLWLDPGDALGASLELARLEPAARVGSAPAAYVEALFNAYAEEFDQSLVGRLEYAAPQLIAEMIRAAKKAPFPRALDLGCGTGLAGEALRAEAAYLEGVDIAAGMVEVSRMKGVYDSLHHAEMHAHLRSPGKPFDLIVATDVFTYVGDLGPLLAAIAERLAPGGLAAFTVEKGGAEDWEVRESLRFAHGPAYIERLAARSGLAVDAVRDIALRKDRGAAIAGLAVVLKAADSGN